AIDAVCNSDQFRHSKYVALKTKDAIVDQFRARYGRRPSVDLEDPTLRIHIHIRDQECSVALDSSGRSLHKRGYKIASVPAPINEVLAAGILKIAGWPIEAPFLDPMCGSGTLPLEAAMLALRLPAQQLNPHFGFQKWPDFDAKLWGKVVEQAQERVLPKWRYPIVGRDIDPLAVRAAKQNATKLGVRQFVQFEKGDFIDGPPTDEDTVLVMNPPYDERLSIENIEYFYKCIGDQLKQHCTGSTAWIISSNFSAMKSVGLRPSRKILLYNGPLECRLFKYEMYAGTKKVHKQTSPS
ncbi:MAG: class I SAM-dependent RNA methyltransferase, partial [Phaeodactylibacter sp.]|nr:class I SAM-dependent RNA methyltransferase [Phaeodactylibacter sp.]